MKKELLRILGRIGIILFCVMLPFSPWLCCEMESCYYKLYYSDSRLCKIAEECIVQDIGVESLNAELSRVFESRWKEPLVLPKTIGSSSGSCLGRLKRRLPSNFGWELLKYERHKAVAIKYGNRHARYVWLVAVDPAEHIKFDCEGVRRIADNIAVVIDDNEMYQRSFEQMYQERHGAD